MRSLAEERGLGLRSEVERAAEGLSAQLLKARVAELEGRGGPVLRAREEALNEMESRLKGRDESVTAWFVKELPRLLSGLPVPEESLAGYSDGLSGAAFAEDKGTYGAAGGGLGYSPSLPISSRMAGVMGLDRSFALAQALCASKAAQSALESRVSGLSERNSLLREKVLELEAVIGRWRHSVEKAFVGAAADSKQGSDKADLDLVLLADAKKSSLRATELEEQVIVLSGRLEHSAARARELQRQVEVLLGDEQVQQDETLDRRLQLRLELEAAHAAETRTVREHFEAERASLREQIASLTASLSENVVEVGALKPMSGPAVGEDSGAGHSRNTARQIAEANINQSHDYGAVTKNATKQDADDDVDDWDTSENKNSNNSSMDVPQSPSLPQPSQSPARHLAARSPSRTDAVSLSTMSAAESDTERPPLRRRAHKQKAPKKSKGNSKSVSNRGSESQGVATDVLRRSRNGGGGELSEQLEELQRELSKERLRSREAKSEVSVSVSLK
jgi:hypothetical protein